MVLEGFASLSCSVLPAPVFATPAVVWEGALAPVYCAVWLLLLGFAASDAVAPLRAVAAASAALAPAAVAPVDASISGDTATVAVVAVAVAYAVVAR